MGRALGSHLIYLHSLPRLASLLLQLRKDTVVSLPLNNLTQVSKKRDYSMGPSEIFREQIFSFILELRRKRANAAGLASEKPLF